MTLTGHLGITIDIIREVAKLIYFYLNKGTINEEAEKLFSLTYKKTF